jgi:hypothetical protein
MTPAQAATHVAAYLGRPADDAFEAAVVLETVCGLDASTALRLASDLVRAWLR